MAGESLPGSAKFSVGDIEGFRPLSELGADEPVGRPEIRTAGAPMLYTSGTTGRPKGVRRPLTGPIRTRCRRPAPVLRHLRI